LAALADQALRAVLPDAVVDLRTPQGVARVRGASRYSDTRINEIDHHSVGPDLKASGPPNRTYDFTPDARATDLDDSNWEVIPADSLEKRRAKGRLCLNWYRFNVTIPEKIGSFDTRGSTAVFEIVVDDYAEVWVNGNRRVMRIEKNGLITVLADRFEGMHLGTLRGPEHPHNMAWGDADGRTLYLSAQTSIYRIRLNVSGAGALPKPPAMAKK